MQRDSWRWLAPCLPGQAQPSSSRFAPSARALDTSAEHSVLDQRNCRPGACTFWLWPAAARAVHAPQGATGGEQPPQQSHGNLRIP